MVPPPGLTRLLPPQARAHALLFTLLLTFLPSTARAAITWHDAATLTVEGRGWPMPDSPFQRLPSHARETVPPAVWDLSRSSAGITVRFTTRADRIDLRWSLTSPSLAMPHMPATGVSGIDLYLRNPGTRTWRFVQNARPTRQHTNEVSLRIDSSSQPHDCLLYLPLYNGISQLELGVDSPLDVSPAPSLPSALHRPVALYGTSIVQGGCASRPGLAYPAILGRQLDRPIINLGFSGSGRMEPGVVQTLAELDPALFIIDCLWNLSDQPPDEIERRVTQLVGILRRKHADTPILFIGQSNLRSQLHPTPGSQAQQRAVQALSRSGVPALHLIPGNLLLGSDHEGTVDGVHPNDLGMMRHADFLHPVIQALLPGPSPNPPGP